MTWRVFTRAAVKAVGNWTQAEAQRQADRAAAIVAALGNPSHAETRLRLHAIGHVAGVAFAQAPSVSPTGDRLTLFRSRLVTIIALAEGRDLAAWAARVPPVPVERRAHPDAEMHAALYGVGKQAARALRDVERDLSDETKGHILSSALAHASNTARRALD